MFHFGDNMFVSEKYLSSAYEEICIEYLHCTKYFESLRLHMIEKVAILIEITPEVKRKYFDSAYS